MSNISNKLKELFNAYLVRIEEEKKTKSTTTYSYNHHRPFGGNNYLNESIGVIHFYEWSDVNRVPKNFYTMEAFERFLMSSCIFMAAVQKEIIHNIYTCYIACKKGSKDLIIKHTYEELKKALEEDKEPYNVSITRAPSTVMANSVHKNPMYADVEGRWPECEQVSDWWG